MIKISILIIILITLIIILYSLDFSKKNIKWGVTFSQPYAQNELGLNWQDAYLAILDDLKVKNIRLSAYWNQIEPERDVYNFEQLDWQIKEASKRNVNIILSVGRRLPRWPECHDPKWLNNLINEEIKQEQLEVVDLTVKRYRDNPFIETWQIENEPFLSGFGQCPPLDKEAFQAEIKLVKSLTPIPVMTTDSGELHFWIKVAKTGVDIVGSTLYESVYNEKFGYFKYPLPPAFYYLKAQLVKMVFGLENVINSELQTEAWHTDQKNLTQMTLTEVNQSMSISQFKTNIKFAERAGFNEIYLWGAEWWYFMKEKNNYPDYWNEAKKLWK